MGSIFQEALKIIRSKNPVDWTEEEQHTVNAATIPLNMLPAFNDMTIELGLEVLAALAKLRDDVQEIWERLFKGQFVAAGKESNGRCDFGCNKTGEPLIAFRSGNGHVWVCHMSCLKEQCNVYQLLEGVLSQSEQ